VGSAPREEDKERDGWIGRIGAKMRGEKEGKIRKIKKTEKEKK
jgi:hypothetical protein